jgi:hypothetical protein
MLKNNQKNLNELDAKERLETALVCRKHHEQTGVRDRTIILLPIFLSLKFQCIENPKHTRIIIVSRIDFIMEHIRVIQDCVKCKGKANLIGVN